MFDFVVSVINFIDVNDNRGQFSYIFSTVLLGSSWEKSDKSESFHSVYLTLQIFEKLIKLELQSSFSSSLLPYHHANISRKIFTAFFLKYPSKKWHLFHTVISIQKIAQFHFSHYMKIPGKSRGFWYFLILDVFYAVRNF